MTRRSLRWGNHAFEIYAGQWLGFPKRRVENVFGKHMRGLHIEIAVAVDQVDDQCVLVHDLCQWVSLERINKQEDNIPYEE